MQQLATSCLQHYVACHAESCAVHVSCRQHLGCRCDVAASKQVSHHAREHNQTHDILAVMQQRWIVQLLKFEKHVEE